MRGIQSGRPTCPTAGSTARRSRPSCGQGGGKGTRTVAVLRRGLHHDGRRGRPARAARPRRSCRRTLLVRHTVPGLRRQDQRDRHPRRAAPRRRRPRRFDLGASVRSAVGALLLGLTGSGRSALVVAADIRTGLPGSGDEAGGRRRRGRVRRRHRRRRRRWSPSSSGAASVTDEFVERWRTPGEQRTKIWDDSSARSATRRSASRRGTRRSRPPGSPPSDVDAPRSSPPQPAGGARRSAASSTACR